MRSISPLFWIAIPTQLSGGQQQRVAIGRAIVREPKVFLFDEPFSNFDAALRNHMRGEVKELHARFGVTSVFVTHDQEEALSISDRIAIMHRGRIEQVGTPEEIYSRPATTYVATFIGHPRMDLVPIELEERVDTLYAKAGKAEFPLDHHQRHLLRSHRGLLDFSIRPEHIALADSRPNRPSQRCSAGWSGNTHSLYLGRRQCRGPPQWHGSAQRGRSRKCRLQFRSSVIF